MLTELQYHGRPRSVSSIIKDQQEFLSYIDYTDPTADANLVCVTKLNTNYSPTFTAYRIKDGTTCNLKVHKTRNPKDTKVKKCYRDDPFQEGDILLLKKWERKQKVRKGGEGEPDWVPIPGVYEWWINDYNGKN